MSEDIHGPRARPDVRTIVIVLVAINPGCTAAFPYRCHGQRVARERQGGTKEVGAVSIGGLEIGIAEPAFGRSPKHIYGASAGTRIIALIPIDAHGAAGFEQGADREPVAGDPYAAAKPVIG